MHKQWRFWVTLTVQLKISNWLTGLLNILVLNFLRLLFQLLFLTYILFFNLALSHSSISKADSAVSVLEFSQGSDYRVFLFSDSLVPLLVQYCLLFCFSAVIVLLNWGRFVILLICRSVCLSVCLSVGRSVG